MARYSVALAAIASFSLVSAFGPGARFVRPRATTKVFLNTYSDSLSPLPTKPADNDGRKEEPATTTATTLSLDERTSAMLCTSADTTFGMKSLSSFRSTLENVRDSKARTQRRMDRSALEKKHAAEKIAQMERKLAEETARVNAELSEKMVHAQRLINEEVQVIAANIRTEVEHELRREYDITKLVDFIKSVVESKEAEIASEETITIEMMKVRSKVKEGAISSQIDHVLDQKVKVAAIEVTLVQDLKDCVVELELFQQKTKDRLETMSHALLRFDSVDSKVTDYSWKDVEKMEKVLDTAMEDVDMCSKTVRVVRDWVNEAALDKSAVLGEAVPATLKEVDDQRKAEMARELELKNRLKQLESTASTSIEEVNHFKDLDESSETEVIGAFAKAAGEAALAGGKMAVFGLKSILDSSLTSEVGEKTSEAFKKSSGVTKGISDLSKKVRATTTEKNVLEDKSEAVEDLMEIIQSEIMKDTLKSTGETLGAMGQVAGEIAGNVKDTDSSKKAGKAAMETGKSLMDAFSAAAVLAKKEVVKGVEKVKEKAEEKKMKP